MSRLNSFGGHIRLMVLGEKHVGKSALIVKYLTGRFIYEYQSDFDWKYAYQTEIDNEQVHMEIIDSLTMDEAHIRWAEGFMIVYDYTKAGSLKQVEKLKRRIEIIRGTKMIPVVVVGNKIDLIQAITLNQDIKQDQSGDFLRKISSHHFTCSACGSEIPIRQAFDQLCRDVAQFRLHTTQKCDRRRSSLSQVRQSLKMLVHTGKARGYTASMPNSGNNSPNNSGRASGTIRKFGSSSPFSSLMSAPLLKDVVEDESEINGFFENITRGDFKQQHSFDFPKEENKKATNAILHQKSVNGAMVL